MSHRYARYFRSALRMRARIRCFFRLKARFTTLACLLFIIGTALATASISALWIALTSALSVFAVDVKRRRLLSCVLLLAPILGYLNCVLRSPSTEPLLLLLSAQRGRTSSGSVPFELVGVVFGSLATPGKPFVRPLIACNQVNGFSSCLPTKSASTGDLRIICTTACGVPVRRGDRVRIAGNLRPVRSATVPWSFDEKRYLEKFGVIAVCRPENFNVTGHQESQFEIALESLIIFARERIKAAHRTCLGVERGDLLSSMVIGNAAVSVTDDLSVDFRDLSLSHIIAASGFNLTIVTALVWWVFSLFTRMRPITCAASLIAVMFFAAIAGFSASVERAAIMCAMVLSAGTIWRSAYLPASMGVAAVLSILLNPLVLRDVGFQLSYIATAGIVFGAQSASDFWRVTLPRVPRALTELTGVTIIAQLSVLPVQLIYFWQIGILSALANVAISPLIPVITVMGFASSVLSLFPGSCFALIVSIIDALVAVPLGVLLAIIRWLASLRMLWLTGPPGIGAVTLYYLNLVVLIAILRARLRFPKQIGIRQLLFALLLFFLSAIFLLRPAHPACPIAVFDTICITRISDGSFSCWTWPGRKPSKCQGLHAAKIGSYFGCGKLSPPASDQLPEDLKNMALRFQNKTTHKRPSTRIYAYIESEQTWRPVARTSLPKVEPLANGRRLKSQLGCEGNF